MIRTDPTFGTMVEEGSTIEVYVSSGPEEIEVPPVVGQTRAEAERLITEAGLSVGQVTERADATFAEGIVIEQDPPQGVRVGVDAPVNLVVSTGPETVIVPELVNLSERDATAQLQALGLLVRVQDEYSDTVARGPRDSLRPRGRQPRSSSVTPSSSSSRRARHPSRCPT